MKNLLLIICLFFLIACNPSKKTTSSEVLMPVLEKPIENVKKDTIVQHVKKDTVIQEKKESSKVEKAVKKDIYNIAVILPFDVDQVPLDYSPFRLDSNKILSENTKFALEFYMGLKTAIENNTPEGLKANFYVLDDAQFSEKTDELLNERPFPDVDIIIGPNYEKGLNKILAFAQKKNIPVFFPGAYYFPQSSPLLYSLLPTEEIHYQHILLEIHKKNPGKTVDVIYDNDETAQESIKKVRAAQSFIKKDLNIDIPINEIPFKVGVTDVIPSGNWSFASDSLSHSVIVASNKDNFVRYLLGRMVFIKNPLTVYGLSAWSKMKVLDINDEFKHQLYITNTTPTVVSQKDNSFAKIYEEEFYKDPTENAYLGYDAGKFITELVKNGFLLSDISEKKISTSAYKFNFQAVKNLQGQILFYSNKQLGWMQLLNLKFVPIAE